MLYLRLLHGRTPNANGELPALDDWGLDGPVLGPFPWVHVTRSEEMEFGDGDGLAISGGFVHYAGVFYADWCIVDNETFQGSPALQALYAPFVREFATPRIGPP